MKPSLIDADILSEFFREKKVVDLHYLNKETIPLLSTFPQSVVALIV